MGNIVGFEAPIVGFAETWRSSEWADVDLAKQYVLGKIDRIEQRESELARRMKKLNNIDAVDPRWLEEMAYPHQITGTIVNSTGIITINQPIFNHTVTRADMLTVLNTDCVLRVDIAGVTSILKVSAVDGTNPICTVVADSGTAIPADGTYTFDILAEVGYDSKDARNPRFIERYFRGCTTQIFDDYVFQIEKTRKIQGMVGVKDEVEHQVDLQLEKMVRDRQRARIQQWPLLSGGLPVTQKNDKQTRLMGLTFWPEFLFSTTGAWTAQWRVDANLLKNLAGENLQLDDLDNLCGFMDDNGSNFQSGNWLIVTTPWIRDYLHNYGLANREITQDSKVAGYFVDRIRLKRAHREVEVISDKHLPRGTLLLTNIDNVGHGSLEGDEFTKGELPAGGIGYEKWQMRAQDYGIVLREAPTSIGMIKNIGDGH
jgi:hypothetical protein